jgi:hypothetical protein
VPDQIRTVAILAVTPIVCRLGAAIQYLKLGKRIALTSGKPEKFDLHLTNGLAHGMTGMKGLLCHRDSPEGAIRPPGDSHTCREGEERDTERKGNPFHVSHPFKLLQRWGAAPIV